MLRHFRKMKAQSTLEYAVLIMVIIGALLAIQTYIKRGVQGRLKSATDDIGDQYSPDNTNAIKTVVSQTKTQEVFGVDTTGVADQGHSETKLLQDETTNTSEQAVIINTQEETWGDN